jgi:GlpG protein
MFKVIELDHSKDPSQFSRILWQQRISHRIYQEADRQILAIATTRDIQRVLDMYENWRKGELLPNENDSASVAPYLNFNHGVSSLFTALLRYPVTLSLILACCMLALIAPLQEMSDLTRLFLYPDFAYSTRTINLAAVMERFSFQQLLNMISPMLLHAGLLHLSFNMLWLWEFGRRIEANQASWVMLPLIVTLALVSNTAQYLFSASIYFGGMSGVVYGLFAYTWMWQLFDPAKGIKLPVNLVIFMLLALFILTMLGLESIADTAHVTGLLCGVLYGASVATASRVQRAMKKQES